MVSTWNLNIMKNTVFWNVILCIGVCFYPEMGPPVFSKVLVNFYHTVWCHIPEDSNLHSYCCRSIMWGSVHRDKRGKMVTCLSAEFHLIPLNTGGDTHQCLGSGTLSALDYVFSVPGLAVQVGRSAHPDVHSGNC
jgi:hypothetical protein